MARRPTVWTICIADFHKLPREARDALCASTVIGSARSYDGLRIARAPGAVMAARIRRADALFCTGDNVGALRGGSRAAVDAILLGEEEEAKR